MSCSFWLGWALSYWMMRLRAVSYTHQHGIEMPHDQLLTKAEAFAIRAGGRSPRVAKQFIEQCAAGVQK